MNECRPATQLGLLSERKVCAMLAKSKVVTRVFGLDVVTILTASVSVVGNSVLCGEDQPQECN